ncbi:MAG: class I SAM-dependent methyltransferase [Chloroflexi bacterium]|nr:class I SAM-dependent methyltransferase [Chloroflexota bacterium]
MGEGGQFQRVLIGPQTERLLDLKADDGVLDIACGNGAFSRRMAALGARVVASDFSEVFLRRARERTIADADRIEYRLIDATDGAQLLALGERRFDAAVCTMGMMDMADIEPLMSALSRLLKVGGRFVFSVMHPCFNNDGVVKIVEEDDREGELVIARSVKIVRYLRPAASKGLGVRGQPVPHVYFHRPLNVLFNTAFGAGFVVDALEEPAFDTASPDDRQRPFTWDNFSEIPPVLIARLRLLRA